MQISQSNIYFAVSSIKGYSILFDFNIDQSDRFSQFFSYIEANKLTKLAKTIIMIVLYLIIIRDNSQQ
ncbi:hypothetical protein LCGC14_1249280 [marine sediment metagenome]|uniref:Uncharacterized protein n=1 Tax=marine sediment metagenome TaxID=412755 RepID=A0A0F9P7I3_9ZZZZ